MFRLLFIIATITNLIAEDIAHKVVYSTENQCKPKIKVTNGNMFIIKCPKTKKDTNDNRSNKSNHTRPNNNN